MKLKNKQILILTLGIPLIVILIAIYLVTQQKKLAIFPAKDLLVSSYNDVLSNGNSKILFLDKGNDNVTFSYLLNDGYKYPYCGVIFKKKSFFDISIYDYVTIKIKSQSTPIVRFTIESYLEGITDKEKLSSFLHQQVLIPVEPVMKKFTFSLSQFKVPEWWLRVNQLSKDDKRIKNVFAKVSEFDIQSEEETITGINNTITVQEITCCQSSLRIIITTGVFLLIYTIVVLTVLQRKYHYRLVDRVNKVDITYKQIAVPQHPSDSEKIIAYIENNYNDPDLTIKNVSYNCQVSSLKIPKIINEKFKLSFKTYVNAIRLQEAKKLLTDTDKKVIDIAFEVGFNSISHFNRIFKRYLEMTPVKYRNKHGKKQ